MMVDKWGNESRTNFPCSDTPCINKYQPRRYSFLFKKGQSLISIVPETTQYSTNHWFPLFFLESKGFTQLCLFATATVRLILCPIKELLHSHWHSLRYGIVSPSFFGTQCLVLHIQLSSSSLDVLGAMKPQRYGLEEPDRASRHSAP